MPLFPAAIHPVALTVTGLEASRARCRRLLDTDPVIDEDVPPGHGLSFRDHDEVALELWAPRS